jgi:hypothetical protein
VDGEEDTGQVDGPAPRATMRQNVEARPADRRDDPNTGAEEECPWRACLLCVLGRPISSR